MRVHDRRGLVGVYECRGEFAGLVDSELRVGEVRNVNNKRGLNGGETNCAVEKGSLGWG